MPFITINRVIYLIRIFSKILMKKLLKKNKKNIYKVVTHSLPFLVNRLITVNSKIGKILNQYININIENQMFLVIIIHSKENQHINKL